MAKKADNKPAATERVTFTSGAADRIVKVVRAVEGGDRDCGPLTFGARIGGVSGKTFRVCTFTGAWSINATKTVTFKNQTATPNTVAAVNLFFPVTNTATGDRDCAVAKDGSQWYLVDVRAAVTAASVVTDITLSAVLNTSACTIAVSRTLTTASARFVEFGV
jgi:hypothetical protein